MKLAMSRIIKLVLVLVIVFLGLVFHLRNDQYVAFDYYLGVLELPFSLWLCLALVAGAILGVVSTLPALFLARRERSRVARESSDRPAGTGKAGPR